MAAEGKVVSIEIEAIVTRADGTVEDLGVISAWKAPVEEDPKPRRSWRRKSKET